MKELALPLTGGDNRPIRDALGRIVSIPEHAEAFAHAMNCHQQLIDRLRATIEPLKVGRGFLRPESPAYSNMTRCITQVETAIIMAQKTGLPPAPQEAGADELEHLMGEMLDQDIGVGDFAEAITKRYKVFPR